jgi:putative heme-binding domain-containing protein
LSPAQEFRKIRRVKLSHALAIIGISATAWFRPQTLSAAEARVLTPFSDYHLADAELKVVPIDSDPRESFLALQLDSAGRLFAGAREALFVYEPVPDGLYQPRQLLYRFPKDSWIYGIAIRGVDLYVSTHTAVYVLEGAVLKHEGVKPKRLLWGMPMLPYFEEHQGMHALAFGPEGDLYVSLGDNLVGYGDFKRADHWGHWTFFHGHGATPLTAAGAVVRISPDGETFTPIARGLRNCCGLAFDANWNLFGNDNDHESLPNDYVPGRLVYVTPHAYFGWPRGWLIQKQPWRGDLLQTLNSNLGRYVPTGQAYYDEAFLPEKFRNNLLVAEWGKGVLARYPLQSSGASFTAAQVPLLSCANNVRPVGVAVGRGGRIFVSSLVMAGNEASPVCRSEIVMITRSDDASNAPFSGYEETSVAGEKLFAELETASWHRRSRAHLELMRRGKIIQDEVISRLKKAPAGSSLQSSLIWLAAAGGERKEIERLAVSANDNARSSALRALIQFGLDEDCGLFEKAMGDTNPQITLAALIGVFDHCGTFPREPVFALAESDDSFLRQTAVQLLAEKAALSELQQLCESARPSLRLAGVLALGFRLTVPRTTSPLAADFPLYAKGFSAKAQYVEGMEDLTAHGRIGVFTIADAWAHAARTPEEETIFAILKRRVDDANERVAKQAAFFTRLLKDQSSEAKASAVLGLLPETQTNAPIANARTTGATELPAEFRGLDWEKEAARGDSKKGQELFAARGCAVCHSIKSDDKGGGGPSLAGVGSRFNANYLVESVMVPNKTVAPMFRWTMLRFKNDEELAGLVIGETEDEIQLLLPAGIRQTVTKSKIAKREIQDRSPMPEGLIQTTSELRDLLAYLLSQKQPGQ